MELSSVLLIIIILISRHSESSRSRQRVRPVPYFPYPLPTPTLATLHPASWTDKMGTGQMESTTLASDEILIQVQLERVGTDLDLKSNVTDDRVDLNSSAMANSSLIIDDRDSNSFTIHPAISLLAAIAFILLLLVAISYCLTRYNLGRGFKPPQHHLVPFTHFTDKSNNRKYQ